jgi:hypothetical protein
VIRWIPAMLLAMLASWPAYARAQQVFPVANPAVIRMQMQSGKLTIRTWNRPIVQIESDTPVHARHFGPQAVAGALTSELTIPVASIQTADGPVSLPAEFFPLGPSVLDAPHDGIVIFGGNNNANVTLTIPNTTALVWAIVGRGTIALNGYRSGEFVLLVHTGRMFLQNSGGDGYAQVARGRLGFSNSAFNRIRARTAAGNIIFENCNVRQVEASSVNGSVAYDNGTFVPGVARFESQNANVAIGVAGGGASIAAHSSSGHIYSGFSRGASVNGSPTDAQAVVGSGGPVVTANSERGAVYLYDGSLRTQRKLQNAWQPVGRMLRRQAPHPRRPRQRP